MVVTKTIKEEGEMKDVKIGVFNDISEWVNDRDISTKEYFIRRSRRWLSLDGLKRINVDDVWVNSFYNAKKFFESKGNIKTRSRLKDKWYKEFMKPFKDFEERSLTR
jgi:hypothetical protein